MRRLWKTVLLAVLFALLSLLIGGLTPPSWMHPSHPGSYTQQ